MRMSAHLPCNIALSTSSIVTSKKVITCLNIKHILSDKQPELYSYKLTGVDLIVITHRIIETLHNESITRAIALDISKSFDKVCVGNCYMKSLALIILVVFSTIKYFLSNGSINVVVNGQSLETHEINAELAQCFLICFILFLLYINDFTKKILTLLVNMYADDTMFYRSTTKNLEPGI